MPRMVVKNIDELEYIGKRILVKGDQERSLTAVLEKVAETRRGDTVPAAPAQGDSSGNADVESWIRRATWSCVSTVIADWQGWMPDLPGQGPTMRRLQIDMEANDSIARMI